MYESMQTSKFCTFVYLYMIRNFVGGGKFTTMTWLLQVNRRFQLVRGNKYGKDQNLSYSPGFDHNANIVELCELNTSEFFLLWRLMLF